MLTYSRVESNKGFMCRETVLFWVHEKMKVLPSPYILFLLYYLLIIDVRSLCGNDICQIRQLFDNVQYEELGFCAIHQYKVTDL